MIGKYLKVLSIPNIKPPNFIHRCLDSISSSAKSLEQVKIGVNRGRGCSHASVQNTDRTMNDAMRRADVLFSWKLLRA